MNCHTKNVRGYESGEASNRSFAEIWRGMSINDNCFMVEIVIFEAKETLPEPRASRQRRELRREVLEIEKKENVNRGGGGWPSTAASQP